LKRAYAILASVETRKTPCGLYTTYPTGKKYDDRTCI
jgi:hypothetical protein